MRRIPNIMWNNMFSTNFPKQIHGDTIEMREVAARMCRDYLHGAWKKVTAQDIGFKHIR